MALFGIVGLAAFAGTCTVTHINLASTDGTHNTFAGQLDNTSGVNILQHNFVVAFIDSGNNLVSTASVPGCLNSVQNNTSDFFSAVSTTSAGGVSVGLARIAFDSTFKVGNTSAQNVTISNVHANRTTASTPATLTVTGSLQNNSGVTLVSPNVCVVVRTSLGNVLITAKEGLGSLGSTSTTTFSVSATVPNDSTATTVDVWVDGLDSASNPTTPQSLIGTTVTQGGLANHMTFSTQPIGNVAINQLIVQNPTVSVLDINGNLVTGTSLPVTLSVLAGTAPLNTVVTCSTTSTSVIPVNGIATFSGCTLNHSAPNIQLTATYSGLASINSSTFNIVPGAVASLVFSTPPPTAVVSTTPFSTAVTAQDANLDPVWNVASTITLTGTGLTGCVVGVSTGSIGVATFSGCLLASTGTLTATDTASHTVVSGTITVTAATATPTPVPPTPTATPTP
jgi:hypothetical protein